MKNFPHLAQRIYNTPLMIHPDKARIILSAISGRFGIHSIDGNVIVAGDAEYQRADEDRTHAYDEHEGFAIIPIKGTLVQSTGSLRMYSGQTGYDGIRQNFIHAVENPKVKAIILDVDSGGGECAGCFDLVDTIYEARAEKPIISILSECAYSAAYALASAAHRVTVPRTGGAGSIGVICLHADYSEALAEAGIKITMIKYGDLKAAGSPYEPLKGKPLRNIQSDIDEMGELFIETVARNRDLPAKKIREMEAATFLGKNAVDNDLCDDVVSPNIEFNNLIDTIS